MASVLYYYLRWISIFKRDRMERISCTLLKTLMMPKLMKRARTVAVIMREFSESHISQPICILKE